MLLFFTGTNVEWIIFKKANYLSFWLYKDFSSSQLKELPRIYLMRRDSSLTDGIILEPFNANKWHRVTFPISILTNTHNNKPSDFIAVVFSYQKGQESQRHVLHVDDIELLETDFVTKTITTKPAITSASNEYAMHVDITWNKITDRNIRLVKIYRSTDAKNLSVVGVQEPCINRFTDFNGKTGQRYFYSISFLDHNYKETKRSDLVPGITRTMSDDELLTMVQQASFRYYWEAAELSAG